jgi:hypothetical protein
VDATKTRVFKGCGVAAADLPAFALDAMILKRENAQKRYKNWLDVEENGRQNMRAWKRQIVILVVSGIAGACWGGGDQGDLKQRLALDLSDGSHVVGLSAVATITVRTSVGAMSLPLTQIASMTFGDDSESVVVAMDNGDRVSGVHSLSAMRLTASFGDIAIPVKLIRKLDCIPTRMQRQLGEGLVLYYSFDGNIRDASGKENNGIVTGVRLTEDRKGRENAAGWFNGESFIEVRTSPSLDLTNAITIAAWVKHDPGPNDANRPQEDIVCKINPTSWNRGYRLTAWWLNPDGYACELYNGSQHICSIGEDPVIGKWTHVAATWDGEVMRLFQNGQLRSSARFQGTISVSGGALFVGIHTLKNQAMFRGTMDELRIYNRALSDAEIASLLGE